MLKERFWRALKRSFVQYAGLVGTMFVILGGYSLLKSFFPQYDDTWLWPILALMTLFVFNSLLYMRLDDYVNQEVLDQPERSGMVSIVLILLALLLLLVIPAQLSGIATSIIICVSMIYHGMYRETLPRYRWQKEQGQ
ncbi:MAG TPA: hypothetical protein VGM95_00825 [Lactobacillaceae bacterium]|jgi:cobalamin synthase